MLIPRPETELLVEKALELASGMKEIRILDICTGSGCILTSLLMHLPNAAGVGLDISERVLATAEKNLKKHDVAGRASLVQGDALELDKLELGRFDLITCNPPYLSDDEWEEADKSLKYEPKIALSSGLTHFCFIKKLMDMTPDLCNKKWWCTFRNRHGAVW